MGSKRNIKSFGKTYDYLSNPTLRANETGNSQLTIEGAEFSGVNFQYLSWKNVRFVRCDFAGAYETKLDRLENSSFENCRFVGIHGFGDMVDVKLSGCAVGGESYLKGYSGSERLVFEECDFIGTSANPNHWGAVGSYGHAQFIACRGKWFSVDGDTALELRDCEFEDVRSRPDARESGGVSSVVLIEGTKLRGTYDMRAGDIQSLTIRDTQIDVLDMNNATVKGDVLMERVRASRMVITVRSGRSISLKELIVTGNGREVFYLPANRFENVVLDNVKLPDNPADEKCWIGGAQKEPAYTAQPPVNKNITLRNSKLPQLDTSHLNTRHLRIENTQIDRADMSHGRIGTLEFRDVTFGFTLDLSQTQVGAFRQSGGTDLRTLDGFKSEGSSVVLPR